MLRALTGYGLRFTAALGLLLVLAAPQRGTPWLLDPRALHPAPRQPASPTARSEQPSSHTASDQAPAKPRPARPAGLLFPDIVEPRPAGEESRAICRAAVQAARPLASAQAQTRPGADAVLGLPASWRDLRDRRLVISAAIPPVPPWVPRAVALLSSITLLGPPRA